MIQLQFLARVDEKKCTGCKHCERICPSGAIEMMEKKATINGDRCIDCQRCIDRCNKGNAISRTLHPSEIIRYVDYSGVDQVQLKTLCRKAILLPDMSVCGCTRTTVKEAVMRFHSWKLQSNCSLDPENTPTRWDLLRRFGEPDLRSN